MLLFSTPLTSPYDSCYHFPPPLTSPYGACYHFPHHSPLHTRHVIIFHQHSPFHTRHVIIFHTTHHSIRGMFSFSTTTHHFIRGMLSYAPPPLTTPYEACYHFPHNSPLHTRHVFVFHHHSPRHTRHVIICSATSPATVTRRGLEQVTCVERLGQPMSRGLASSTDNVIHDVRQCLPRGYIREEGIRKRYNDIFVCAVLSFAKKIMFNLFRYHFSNIFSIR